MLGELVVELSCNGNRILIEQSITVAVHSVLGPMWIKNFFAQIEVFTLFKLYFWKCKAYEV
jgi:hypothetical protein